MSPLFQLPVSALAALATASNRFGNYVWTCPLGCLSPQSLAQSPCHVYTFLIGPVLCLQRMGSSDSRPASVTECIPVPSSSSSNPSTGHWLRQRRWLPGMWCYEGSVCSKDRQRSLEGYTVFYGGPQTCNQAGYATTWGSEDRFDTTGTWYQP